MTNLLGYVGAIDKSQQKNAGVAGREYLYALRVAPSCPPSKVLHVRGGRNYLGNNYTVSSYDAFEQRAYTIPDLTADLADTASVTVDITFSTANHYQFFLLELRTPATAEQPSASDWSFHLHGTEDEFETAGEAEAWLHSATFQLSGPWQSIFGAEVIVAYPLCGLVLKNDGVVGNGCNILPVDAINRGRSYIWPRDMRPLQLISI